MMSEDLIAAFLVRDPNRAFTFGAGARRDVLLVSAAQIVLANLLLLNQGLKTKIGPTRERVGTLE